MEREKKFKKRLFALSDCHYLAHCHYNTLLLRAKRPTHGRKIPYYYVNMVHILRTYYHKHYSCTTYHCYTLTLTLLVDDLKYFTCRKTQIDDNNIKKAPCDRATLVVADAFR